MNSYYDDFVRPTAVLTTICVLVAVCLVLTYQVTAPIIEVNKKATADAARAEVYMGVNSFEPISGELPEGCLEAYRAGDEGFVFTTASKGFGGEIKVMTGISNQGEVVGVKVLENAETPGLGTRATEKEYLSQYAGQNAKLEGIEYIGGASVSSKAVKAAIQTAFAAFETQAGI